MKAPNWTAHVATGQPGIVEIPFTSANYDKDWALYRGRPGGPKIHPGETISPSELVVLAVSLGGLGTVSVISGVTAIDLARRAGIHVAAHN